MFIIPRADIDVTINGFPGLSTPCLYILIMGDDRAYIGQTYSFKHRIADHKKKNFEYAYVFVDSSNTMSNAHVQYLEYRAIDDAIKAGKYDLPLNKQIPQQPHLTLEMKSDADKFYEDIKFLVNFVDCDIFYKSVKKESEIIFHCCAKDANARGMYDVANKRFVVFKDSVIEPTTVNSFHNPARRNEWIEKYVATQNGSLVLKKECFFNTPSQASEYVLGRPSNGWVDWKTADGTKTFADIYEH